MVGSASTLAVLGLGAVGWALPATPVVKERQIWGIGGGNAPPPSFTWGPTVPTSTCLSDVPVKEQPPCIPLIIPGQIVPSNPKEKRFTLPDGWQQDKQHAIDILEKRLEALQNKQHKTDADYDEIDDLYAALKYLAGITNISAPPGSTVVFHPGKKTKRFTLPDGWDHDKQHAIDTIEKKIEALQNKKHKTDDDYQELDDLYAALKYLAGVTNISAPPGSTVVFHPGKKAKRFTLPEGWDHDKQHAIDTIEKRIEALQNKKNKTDDDYQELDDLYEALKYLAGVTNISAPPGSTVVFHPGKRSNGKDCQNLSGAELALEGLMHQDRLSPQEHIIAEKLKSYLLSCGITIIKSPDGTSTTIQPSNKRSNGKDCQNLSGAELALEGLMHQDRLSPQEHIIAEKLKSYLLSCGITIIKSPDGTSTTIQPSNKRSNGKDCQNLSGAELALEGLMHQDRLSPQEHIIAEKLKSYLLSCGITIVKSPDGTSTTIQPSNKRSTPPFDLAGVEKAYEALAQSVGTSTPSLYTFLAMEHLASILELYGITIEKTPSGTTTTFVPGKRQITIGQGTCQLADVKGFKQALEALLNAYGPPSKAPWNVQLIEQVIIETLRYCGQDVSGWTGPIIPDPTIPGGPIVPDPTVPGGPITPDPTVPGGPITPDPTYPGSPITPDPTVPGGPITPDPTTPGAPINPSNKRQVLLSDPTALLAALKQLEDVYGHYGSKTIPLPILIIMENMVIVLQAIPGVIVPGWPTIGGGAITPSN